MSSGRSLSRRHFMLGGAGAVVAATRPGLRLAVAGVSRISSRIQAAPIGGHRLELLHNLPDLLDWRRYLVWQ